MAFMVGKKKFDSNLFLLMFYDESDIIIVFNVTTSRVWIIS